MLHAIFHSLIYTFLKWKMAGTHKQATVWQCSQHNLWGERFSLFPTFVHMVIESLLRKPNVWEILLAKICLNIQLFCLWMQSWCKQQSTELCSTSFLPICWFSSEMGKCFRMCELQLSTTYFLPRIHRQYSRCDRCLHHAWHPFRSEASHSVLDVVAILRRKFTISHV